jgi:hypothetical protein
MGLLYRLNDMVKYVCCIGFGSNSYFVAGAALMGDYYKLNIISGVGHSRSNSVILLVLCTVAYNIWGTVVVLQVPRDSTDLVEKG